MHFVSACKHDKEGTLLFRKRWNVRFSRVGNFDTVRSIDSLLSSGFWMSRVSSIVRRSELYRVLYCDGCGFVWYHPPTDSTTGRLLYYLLAFACVPRGRRYWSVPPSFLTYRMLSQATSDLLVRLVFMFIIHYSADVTS